MQNRYSGEPVFYYFQVHEFAHSADLLEKIADNADRAWSEEMKKLNLKPGEGFVKTKQTLELHIAENERRCREVSIYLFAHSLELSLKGLYITNKRKHFCGHKISALYKELKDYIPLDSFISHDLEALFLKLDEVLIWAGRFPNPLNNKHTQVAIEEFSKVEFDGYSGYTDNLSTSINNIANGNGVKLMKDFLRNIWSLGNPLWTPRSRPVNKV